MTAPFKIHFICAHVFIGLKEKFITSGRLIKTSENDQGTPKTRKKKIFLNSGFLKFWKFLDFFLKYLLPWKFYTKWLSLIFHKLLDFRDLENLKHPSWQSWRSDLIGDRVCVESRRNAIKMQPQQSERKISHPHTNLTSNHTLLAKIVNSA